MIRPARSIFALWAAAASMSGADAFAPAHRPSAAPRTTSLNVREPPTKTRKEIKFDGTKFSDEEDCIPDQEFCVINPETEEPIRLTNEEKERMFLDALQAYYVSGRQVMDDAQFDALKEDLAWNGSKVVNLNRKEVKYLEAMQAFNSGKPVMSDEEFDALRDELREEKSSIAVNKEPKCYIETGVCTTTWEQDKFRNNLLYLPANVIVLALWLGIGFELTGGLINPIVLILLGIPVGVWAGNAITNNLIFPNNLVAYGACPSCSSTERIFFGDILGVEGFDKQGAFKCQQCKDNLIVQRRSLRASTLPK